MSDLRWLFQSQKPQFPGKIGCGMRLAHSRRRTENRYRSAAAAQRRAARKEYRKTWMRKVKAKDGTVSSVPIEGAPGFKAWAREHAFTVAA